MRTIAAATQVTVTEVASAPGPLFSDMVERKQARRLPEGCGCGRGQLKFVGKESVVDSQGSGTQQCYG